MDNTTVNENQVSTREQYLAMVSTIKTRLRGWESLQKQLKQAGNRSSLAINRYEITATLDYYLAWRGKDYRHGSRPEYRECWAYQNTMRKLVKEFGEPTPKS